MHLFIKILLAGSLSIGVLSACSSTGSNEFTEFTGPGDSNLHELLNTSWELVGIQLAGSEISGQTIEGLHVNKINVAIINHPANEYPLMRIGGNAVPVCGSTPIWVRFDADNSITQVSGPPVPVPPITCVGPEAAAGKAMDKYLQNFNAYQIENQQLKLRTKGGEVLTFKKQCNKARNTKLTELSCPYIP